MQHESRFLNGLIGKMVNILAVDETDLPPMQLEEVSDIGIVAVLENRPRFFPWPEVIEIAAASDILEYAGSWEGPDIRL